MIHGYLAKLCGLFDGTLFERCAVLDSFLDAEKELNAIADPLQRIFGRLGAIS